MSVKLLAEHHLEFLSLKGSCTGSSESTHVKMPHCWKSHVAAHLYFDGLFSDNSVFYSRVLLRIELSNVGNNQVKSYVH